MTWQEWVSTVARMALSALVTLWVVALLLTACSARVTRLPSPPGVAAYRVEFRLGIEPLPEARP